MVVWAQNNRINFLLKILRKFLCTFRLPGEAQKIDRIMEAFAHRFCQTNPTVFENTGMFVLWVCACVRVCWLLLLLLFLLPLPPRFSCLYLSDCSLISLVFSVNFFCFFLDTAYVLAFSLIMLNTGLYKAFPLCACLCIAFICCRCHCGFVFFFLLIFFCRLVTWQIFTTLVWWRKWRKSSSSPTTEASITDRTCRWSLWRCAICVNVCACVCVEKS